MGKYSKSFCIMSKNFGPRSAKIKSRSADAVKCFASIFGVLQVLPALLFTSTNTATGLLRRPEVEYFPADGFVRLSLRRPVNLYVPSELQLSYDPNKESKLPPETLELEWVHGYSGRDSRNNLFPLASGEIVYFTASVAIVYDPTTKTQRHFAQHTDDIKSLAVHPDGKTVATGQIKGLEDILPHVRVWDSETLELLHTFGNDTFDKEVNCIAFNKEGDLLAAIDGAQEPRLSVWQWADETKLGQTKAAADPILGVTFSNEFPARIVTSGKNHLAFWTLSDSGELNKRSAIFGSYEKPKYVTSVGALPSGDVVTGDTNGNILVWKQGGNTVRDGVSGAHEGPVFYVGVSDNGTIMSAGKDRKIVVYNEALEATEETLEIAKEFGSPRVAFKLGDDLYIGTTNNTIIKTTFENEPTVITQGHLEELWGFAAHPTEMQFVTAGQGGQVFFRDAITHQTIWNKTLETACQSADIAPSGAVTVIGGSGGKWFVLDNESQDIIHVGDDGEEPIQVTRFSPDGTKLALGSRDNKVYIYKYDAEDKAFSKQCQCEGHSSFITHLDWSEDGEIIRTNSGDYEVLFWKADDCSQLTQSEDYKDVEFATNTCILAFNSIGIWPPGMDGTHINACNKAKEKPLIASGDDFGKVKLFTYPSRVHNAKHHSYGAHSSHVTNVAFLHDDSMLVTVGGRDLSAMQWKVVGPTQG